MSKIADVFINTFDKNQILLNEPMKNHTSFKIGGPAKVFFKAYSSKDIIKALNICRDNNIPYYIMGNGTNLLFSDNGYNGVIISICDYFSDILLLENGIIYAESGTLLSSVANFALNNGIKGLEFASGIPGTLGGAVCMNAGAYGGEMKDVIVKVKAVDKEGEIHILTNEDMLFSYRTSLAQEKSLVVLSAEMKLEKGNKEEISAKMKELNSKRREKQPLDKPSAGSTFKRPEGNFAGKLIMDAGLRGYQIGDAQISEKHCGFVINKGAATCEDVLKLLEYVKVTVRDKFGVVLEPEIRIIGE